MARGTDERSGARWDDLIKSERRPRRRPPREKKRRRGWIYLVVFLMILAVFIMSLLVYVQLKLKASSQEIVELTPQVSNEPMNVLVLGSDARDVLPEEEIDRFDPTGADRTTGRRADTIILIHIDERREKAVVLHFPRDLKVTYPDGKEGKINGAYQAGPGFMIDTVEAFSGLPVHHYVEANFVGFRNIVNALGGVKVHFEKPIKEDDSGLNVPAGCVELQGDQALAFVRVRKIDDDFGRIARQQLFMSLMMEKVRSAGTILNPVRIVKLVNLTTANVTTDANLSLGDIKDLSLRLRSFDPKRVDMRVVPSASQKIRGTSYVVANKGQTDALLAAIRERRGLPDYGRTGVSAIEPGEIRVTPLNGTDQRGLAAKGAEELKARSFQVGVTLNADRADYKKTTVYFQEGFPDQASVVAEAYGAQVKPMPKTIEVTTEVAIVFGLDYAEGRATPPPPPPPAKAPAPPLVHRCSA